LEPGNPVMVAAGGHVRVVIFFPAWRSVDDDGVSLHGCLRDVRAHILSYMPGRRISPISRFVTEGYAPDTPLRYRLPWLTATVSATAFNRTGSLQMPGPAPAE